MVEDSCALLGPSLRGLVQTFRVVLNRSGSETFRVRSIDFHLHVDAAFDGIIIRFSGGAASEYGNSSTKRKFVVDPPAERELIKLKAVFFFRVPIGKLRFWFLVLLVFIVVKKPTIVSFYSSVYTS